MPYLSSLQESLPLNREVVYFLENFCNTELLNGPQWHVHQSGYHLLLQPENHNWKWPCVCWCGFSCTKECKFLMLVILFWVNWASAVNSISCRICSLGCRLHKIVHGWRDHLVKGVVLVEDHIMGHIFLYLWLCFTSHYVNSTCTLYLGFVELLPKRHLLLVIVHILHLLVGNSVYSFKWCAGWNSAVCVMLPVVCSNAELLFPLGKSYM